MGEWNSPRGRGGVGFYRFWGSQLPNFQGKSTWIFPPITPMVGTFWGQKSLKALSNKVFRFIQQALSTTKKLTQIKKTEEKNWLTEVSSIPLQQSLRDLETAYSNFFASCQGERKGKKVKPPKFKKRKSKQSARFTDNGFTVNQHHVTLAKIGDLKVVWSRPLPSKPSSVTVIKDAADRYLSPLCCWPFGFAQGRSPIDASPKNA
jgi:transposase